MAYYPDLLGPTMGALLDCAEDALIENGRPAALVHLVPGLQVAWDNCCEGEGQLWVRVLQVYPTGGPAAPFPQQDVGQSCGVAHLAAVLGVGVVRCVHTLDDQGDPPTGQEMTGDALGMTADMAILLGAIECCFIADRRPTPRVGVWTPQGAQGGCGGGEWQLTVGVSACGCNVQPPPPAPGA